jgi:broad specificity phosphatase PhoE
MLIYLRHGNDEVDGRPFHRDDRRLNIEGKKQVRRAAKALYKKYGLPDIIFCSPMKRAKETVKEIKRGLFKATGSKVKIIIDNKLSRYFNSREQEDPSILPETAKLKIPIFETKDAFKYRCKKQYNKCLRKAHKAKIWCVTHVLVLKQVAAACKVQLPEHVPFLYSFKIPKSYLRDRVGTKKRTKASERSKSKRCIGCPKNGKLNLPLNTPVCDKCGLYKKMLQHQILNG